VKTRRLLFSFLITLSTGCGLNNVKEQPGNLGKADFGYLCTNHSQGDPYCDFTATNPAFPNIAQGSTFFLGAASNANTAGERFSLRSASPARLELKDAPIGTTTNCVGSNLCSAFPELATAHAVGVTSIIAEGNLSSVDYTDVTVEPIADLALTQVTVIGGQVTATIDSVSGKVTFTDKQVFLRAAPSDSAMREIAGALPTPYAWTTSNANVVSIMSGGDTNIVELGIGASGMATLTVTQGPLMKSTTVTVP